MKRLLAAMTAALLTVALVGPASAASAKWLVWQYDPISGNGPYSSTAANPHAGTIATFAFDSASDQALLTTTASGYMKKGNLLGKAVTATISITAPVGTVFTGYDNCAGGLPPTVRFYFDTNLILGAETTFQTGLYEDQMWWSNPVSVTLADVWAAGPKGVTLSVTFDPALWSNLVGAKGNALIAPYASDFGTAASNVNQVGFSFGSGCSFAFGDGSSPAGALFNLQKFSTYTP
jgi:hypothetical protein